MGTARDKIVFLMNRWLTSAGGIQTVNRKLAYAVSRNTSELQVIALVTAGEDGDASHAQRNGVTLIMGDDEDNWSPLLRRQEVRDILGDGVVAVAGHSYFSGAQAAGLRDSYCERAKLVQFVHMSPLHTESLKEYRQQDFVTEREQRLAREVEAARRADIVGCIGPRLYRFFSGELGRDESAPRVLRIDCGIDRPVFDDRMPPLQPMILCAGRTDSLGVKGFDLFAMVAGQLSAEWQYHPVTKRLPAPTFEIRGSASRSERLEEDLRDISEQVAGVRARIYVRPYSSEEDIFKKDLSRASVFLMPSREEGYGLVACEAISAGVPILISSESGLADSLKEMSARTGMSINEFIVDHRGRDDDIASAYFSKVLDIFADQQFSADHTHRLREQMYQTASWDAAADVLLRGLGIEPSGLRIESSGASTAGQAEDPLEEESPHRTQRLTEVLSASGNALWQPGVVSVSVEAVVVVTVERGAKPLLPDVIEGIPVATRYVDAIRLLATPTVRPGDPVLLGGVPVSRVGATVHDSLGRQFVTTCAHAFADTNATTHVTIAASNGSEVSAEVARREPKVDMACLNVAAVHLPTSAHSVGVPHLGAKVAFLVPGRRPTGVIVASPVSAQLGVGDRPGVVNDLFEVQLLQEHLGSGDSGSLIVDDESGAALGFVVAVTDQSLREHAQQALAVALEPALTAMALGLVGSEPPVTPVERPRIGVVVDLFTAEILLRAMDNAEGVRVGGTLYTVGRFSPGERAVVVQTLPSAGNISAAIATTRFLSDFQLDHILLVGIAGGLPNAGLQPGDVVLSSEIVYYEPARIGEGRYSPRFRVVGVTPQWLAQVANTINLAGTLRPEAGDIATKVQDSTASVRVGAIASGEKIFNSSSALEELLGDMRGVLAVEMEGAGVAEAVSLCSRSVPLTVIRGIADLLDDMKRDDFRQLAARAAISVATQVVRRLGS